MVKTLLKLRITETMANFNKKNWYKIKSVSDTESKAYNFKIISKYGYDAFNLYFPEDLENCEQTVENIKLFELFIYNNISLFPLPKIKEEGFYTIDLKLLLINKDLNDNWENFKTNIFENTNTCLKCMGLAMHQVISTSKEENLSDDEFKYKIINVRLTSVEPILQIKDVRTNLLGKLLSIRGTSIKSSVPKLRCLYMEFRCNTCSNTQVIKQIDGNLTLPAKCTSKGCRSHNFKPVITSYTRTILYQKIKLQEAIGDTQGESGRIPRTIECDLLEDLVSCCVPGDDIIVTGIVKVRNTNEESYKTKQSTLFLLYLDCVSVHNEKTNSQNTVSTRISFNTSNIPAIQEIHSEPRLFRLLIHSLCPNIYGHEIVKAGLLLALFGGTHNETGRRSDCHVLVVGDPGLGKSQMLQACSNVSPRGIYVCGNTSTGSGLTVTMTRESGEFALEAGALILADQGCCCIDEFDKMTTQHASLLEVMEQQCISIAKASISRSFPTRASILAAANPVGGHYTKAKTVAENLKISSPLLSRFDLIFILLDQPNEQLDMLLSEHVLALHLGKISNNRSSLDSSFSKDQCNITLKTKLMVGPEETINHLPHSLLRSYIAYAQKYVHPKLNDAANGILEQFYIELRQRYHIGDCTPVTARQLESMKRLTEARAKLELRDEATAEDAIEVVEIMRHSLVDVFSDEVGLLDFTRSPSGSGMSGKKQKTKFLNLLQQESKILRKSVFHIKELQQVAQKAGIAQDKFYNTIDSLNINGSLLLKGNRMYHLVSSDF